MNLPSALSLATSPFRGAEYLLDALETAYTGAPLPSSTPDFTETTQALREGVSQNMTETGQFLYDTAMSAADSVVATILGGKSSAAGAILLGLGSASDTAHDIIDRGGTAEQALIGGAVSGILEGVFENFSLSQLESMKALPVSTMKDVLTNIAKSVVTNASEEGLTELAGILFDTIFMDELSTYSLTVQGYLSLGKSQAEAEKLARQELFSRLGESALSGALMGVLFGGGASADSYFRSRLAAQGEARMRSGQLPTDAELEAMNLSESEALGQMILLQMEGLDDAGEIQLNTVVDGDAARNSDLELAGKQLNNGRSIEDMAKIYAERVISNDKWSWMDDFPNAENLSKTDKVAIKNYAIENGLVPDVPIQRTTDESGATYRYADFDAAGLVKERQTLPVQLYSESDVIQFKWLDDKIGGRPDGYTWHHSEINGQMELVPTGIHNIYHHNGGRTINHWAYREGGR